MGVKGKEQYQFRFSNRFAVQENKNGDDVVDINRA
jgi:hypothetical protein